MNEFDENIRKLGVVGYAHLYLWRCNEENRIKEIDTDVFKELVELDLKIGTTASTQLLRILSHTTRSDIIKVSYFV